MNRDESVTPLLLQRLQLLNFRCHSDCCLDFASGVNLIYGDNGSGKTSILEAISLLTGGCSFRRSRSRDLVCWQASNYLVRGYWYRYGMINVEASGDHNSLTVSLQGRQISGRQDLQEHLSLVVDSPQSERLIDDGQRIRRRWIDRLMLTLTPSMGQHCHHYNRAMLQRSRLIRQRADLSQIVPWNMQMVTAGYAWIAARNRVLVTINRYLQEECWIDAEVQLSIKNTLSIIKDSDAIDSGNTDSDSTYYHDRWLQVLAVTNRQLRVGPHCDTISILLNGREIVSCGSHGQQKIVVIILRLVESMLRAESRYIYPVLMLDDCFEALDSSWQQRVLLRLQKYPGQVVLTAPNGDIFSHDGRQKCNRLIPLSSLS
ncbi:MAG: DNA replication and repair protein RecF [Mariprofundales bacterium]|nr:DNA replication and repair protein RecF [Mariprofundales bacterium]